MDGSTNSMPDTEENQMVYPQPDSQEPGVGFPIARMVAVIDYTTGAVLDLAIGPYSGKETGEHALLRQLMSVFKVGDVVLADCCRWFVEIALKSIKETMHMDILRGKTPEMVRKEIWAHLLAYNLIRKIMAQAAVVHNKKPVNLSFKLALQVIASFRQAGIFNEKNSTSYYHLLKAIAYKTVGNRPNRLEPRRVKRRPKPFPKLQKARQLYKRIT